MRCVSGPKLWLVAMALAGGSLPCAGEPREADLSAGPPTAVARSALAILEAAAAPAGVTLRLRRAADQTPLPATGVTVSVAPVAGDRKSTRLNSSHEWISYAVFCLKKKNQTKIQTSPSATPTPGSHYTHPG